LSTSMPQIVEAERPIRTPAGWRPLTAGTGSIGARLVNGVFGDPLLEVKFRSRRERLLFDLGDAAPLSRRVLHTVTDVFLTHAHFDHICGFLHFLRARMTGEYPPCRIYGPPGTAYHIDSLISGIHWDRIEDAGPEFLVADVYGTSLEWSQLKVGHASAHLAPQTLTDGVICHQPEYRVRCTELDHGTPVLAYALEFSPRIHIDRRRLGTLGLAPGAWITALKRHMRAGETHALIELPDGSRRPVAELEAALVVASPGERLVYATDFADTPSNRERLRLLAEGADLFFCEATFCAADAAQALETRHLTVSACVQIAQAAKVSRLVPFHFSKRYTRRVDDVYAELTGALSSP